MTWDERVVRTVHPNGEVTFSIHEAFYDNRKDLIPGSITLEPVNPYGETMEELKLTLERYMRALSKPILELVDDKVVEAEDQPFITKLEG